MFHTLIGMLEDPFSKATTMLCREPEAMGAGLHHACIGESQHTHVQVYHNTRMYRCITTHACI